MGDPEGERSARIEALTPYRVDEAVMDVAAPTAVFLHCLPAHRGEEVAASVIDGPRSLVFAQAANRLCTAQGVLLTLTEHQRRPAPAAAPASGPRGRVPLGTG
jgi:ornithine carbamoyltransferase